MLLLLTLNRYQILFWCFYHFEQANIEWVYTPQNVGSKLTI